MFGFFHGFSFVKDSMWVLQAGFKFHHAESEYLMLTLWLPDGPCTLPPNASHQVGIGAFVLNDKNEVGDILEIS